jgi:hypothetical protein
MGPSIGRPQPYKPLRESPNPLCVLLAARHTASRDEAVGSYGRSAVPPIAPASAVALVGPTLIQCSVGRSRWVIWYPQSKARSRLAIVLTIMRRAQRVTYNAGHHSASHRCVLLADRYTPSSHENDSQRPSLKPWRAPVRSHDPMSQVVAGGMAFRPNKSTGRVDRPGSGLRMIHNGDSFVFDDADAVSLRSQYRTWRVASDGYLSTVAERPWGQTKLRCLPRPTRLLSKSSGWLIAAIQINSAY